MDYEVKTVKKTLPPGLFFLCDTAVGVSLGSQRGPLRVFLLDCMLSFRVIQSVTRSCVLECCSKRMLRVKRRKYR
jgi:hypothetical protein